jgi:hypothetical protein
MAIYPVFAEVQLGKVGLLQRERDLLVERRLLDNFTELACAEIEVKKYCKPREVIC